MVFVINEFQYHLKIETKQRCIKMRCETLDRVKKGNVCIIRRIPPGEIKAQAIRFNLTEGNTAVCQGVIPAGPIVIKIGKQEVALGRNLARQIEVEEIGHETLSRV
jgi:Fe2+ transport system protein FeoA